MRGESKFKKRPLLPDPKYQSTQVAKFINLLMRKGKKNKAQNIVYSALEKAELSLKIPALRIFEKALDNAGPLLEVRPRRIGGATYQVPIEVNQDRSITLAMRWIIAAARDQQGKSMTKFLTDELIFAFKNQGTAVKKRQNMHKVAEANRAFAHYARM